MGLVRRAHLPALPAQPRARCARSEPRARHLPHHRVRVRGADRGGRRSGRPQGVVPAVVRAAHGCVRLVRRGRKFHGLPDRRADRRHRHHAGERRPRRLGDRRHARRGRRSARRALLRPRADPRAGRHDPRRPRLRVSRRRRLRAPVVGRRGGLRRHRRGRRGGHARAAAFGVCGRAPAPLLDAHGRGLPRGSRRAGSAARVRAHRGFVLRGHSRPHALAAAHDRSLRRGRMDRRLAVGGAEPRSGRRQRRAAALARARAAEPRAVLRGAVARLRPGVRGAGHHAGSGARGLVAPGGELRPDRAGDAGVDERARRGRSARHRAVDPLDGRHARRRCGPHRDRLRSARPGYSGGLDGFRGALPGERARLPAARATRGRRPGRAPRAPRKRPRRCRRRSPLARSLEHAPVARGRALHEDATVETRGLACAAVYERPIAAFVARIWGNVRSGRCVTARALELEPRVRVLVDREEGEASLVW